MTITTEEIARLRALEQDVTRIGTLHSSFERARFDVLDALPRLLDDVERLHAYDRALSAVMPADFKDWHQNNPREWPEVAAHVVENLRQREEDACAEIGRLRADLAAVDAAIADRGVPERDCRLPLATRVDSIIGELKEWRHDAATEAMENDALRADLREAVALLCEAENYGMRFSDENAMGWLDRREALLAKHKETP